MQDQAAGLRKIVNQGLVKKHRLVAVTSGKGGVGKTNIAINLALALIGLEQKVALLDADLGLANTDIVLGLYPQYTLLDVLNGQRKLIDIIADGPLGLKIIAGSSGIYELTNLDQISFDRLIDSVATLNAGLDYLIADTGAGINRNVVDFTLAGDLVIIVVAPEPSSMADAYGLVKTILQRKPEKEILILANMVRSPNEGELLWNKINIMTKKFLQRDVKFLGNVLYDRKVSAAVKEQKPFLLAYPSCSASRSIQTVARNLLTSNYICDDSSGVYSI